MITSSTAETHRSASQDDILLDRAGGTRWTHRDRVTAAGTYGVADLVAGPQVELIIPAYNEAARIGATLEAVVDQLAQLNVTSSVLVVDNGSVDRTADVVDQFRSDSVSVRLIGCARRGKGAAVGRGILASTARWVGFCDADLATPASAIVDALALLRAGADVVIGSRNGGGGKRIEAQPVLRRIGGAGFRWLTRDLAGSITDTQCGFKFFAGDVGRQLFGSCEIRGFGFDLEVIARTNRAGLALVELPVTWSDQAGSTFKPLRDGPRVWREVRALRQLLKEKNADLVDTHGLQASRLDDCGSPVTGVSSE